MSVGSPEKRMSPAPAARYGISYKESDMGKAWMEKTIIRRVTITLGCALVASAAVAVPLGAAAETWYPWRFGGITQTEDGVENGVNRLTALDIKSEGDTVVIRVSGSLPPTYKHFTLLEPLQLAVDIGASDAADLSENYPVESALVSGIQISRLEALETTRIGVFLTRDAESQITTEEHALVIRVSPAGGSAKIGDAPDVAEEKLDALEPAPAKNPTEEKAIEVVKDKEATPPPTRRPSAHPTASSGKPARSVTAVESEQVAGGALIHIQLDGRPENYSVLTLDAPDRLVVDMLGISSKLDREVIPMKLAGVARARVGKHEDKVRLVFDLDKPIAYKNAKSGASIVLALGGAALPEENTAAADAAPIAEPNGNLKDADEPIEEAPDEPKEDRGDIEDEDAIIDAPDGGAGSSAGDDAKPAPPEAEAEEPGDAPSEAPAGDSGQGAPAKNGGALGDEDWQSQRTESIVIDVPRKKYEGQKRISLDFKDADIHNVLRIIAEVSNLNVIAGDEVTGTVTIKLKDVPWEEALDVILRSKGLGREAIGDIMRIAKNETLEKELAEKIRKEEQRLNSIPLVTRIIPVNYASATELKPQIEPLLSARGEVRVDERTNNIIVKDIPENVVKAESMVRSLDLQTPQVLIAAKIIEARTNLNHALGVQWGGTGFMDAAHATGTNLPFPNRVGIAGTSSILDSRSGVPANYLVDLPAAAGAGSGGAIGFSFGHIANAVNLNLRLTALEASGDIEVISSPRVTTLDNREAKIKQGFSLPFTTVSSRGTATQFIDAVLELKVTPHVTANKSVIMLINVKKDAPSTEFVGSRGEPSIAKKEASTEVLVKDGETTVIGGIFDSERSVNKRGVPWFSEIPLLGWLFRQYEDRSQRNELLIFITPTVASEG